MDYDKTKIILIQEIYHSLISLNCLEDKFTIQFWVPEKMHVIALFIFLSPSIKVFKY